MMKFFLWLFKGEKRVTSLSPAERTMFLALRGSQKVSDYEWMTTTQRR